MRGITADPMHCLRLQLVVKYRRSVEESIASARHGRHWTSREQVCSAGVQAVSAAIQNQYGLTRPKRQMDCYTRLWA